MAHADHRAWTVQAIIAAWDSQKLTLTGQRRCTPRNAGIFIDSLLRGYPTGELIFRLESGSAAGRQYSVIDGNQRIRILTAFFHGDFRLPGHGFGEYSGKVFAELGEPGQNAFMEHEMWVCVLSGVGDDTVATIRRRCNR